jgi:hypothetical protein
VSWVAARVGRHPVLAGDRPALERLRHVAVHWLGEEERSSLAAWLARRAALGEPLVPGPGGPDGRARAARGERLLHAAFPQRARRSITVPWAGSTPAGAPPTTPRTGCGTWWGTAA